MQDLISKLKTSAAKHKLFLILFSVFIVIYVASSLNREQKKVQENMLTPDTLIPKGHVLVPIELENIETITGLIDSYGVIDIFLGNKLTASSKKILNKVRLIRAPLNPNKFAILLPDSLAKSFMKYDGPFIGIVQNKSEVSNPSDLKTDEIAKSKKISIEYNGG